MWGVCRVYVRLFSSSINTMIRSSPAYSRKKKSYVVPSLDDSSSSDVSSLPDETASAVGSPRYALRDRQSIRPPDCRIIE